MSLISSISFQLKNIVLFPIAPYKVCNEITKESKIRHVTLPITILWIVDCILKWDIWIDKGYQWVLISLSIFIATFASVFIPALLVHLIASVFKSSAGLKNNFICIVYALFFPVLIESIMKATKTGAMFFIPTTLLYMFFFLLVVSSVNKFSYFRVLSFFFCIFLIQFAFSQLRVSSETTNALPYFFSAGIFSSYVKLALIFVVIVTSFLVDCFSNRMVKSILVLFSHIFFLISVCYWIMLFSVGVFFKNPANLLLDYCVKGDSIYFVILDIGVIVAEHSLLSGKLKATKIFPLDGITNISIGNNGNLFLVNQHNYSISVYAYENNGKHVFTIDKETHGCESRYSLIGNNFLFDNNGNFFIGCSSGEIQKYSRTGEKQSEILVEFEDIEPLGKLKASAM